ncbi:restriction endonuclease subunit S, partial [Crenobacter luteus]|uniref:restriction endonuclease subunit S n=1 Tax=Crenobacter luteus TaxID=1452487 RepID=UPI0018D37C97
LDSIISSLPHEWQSPTLGEVSEPVEERVGERKLTPVSISAGIGFVPQAEKFGRDISGSQYKLYTVVRDGEFVYNKGNSLKFPQGCVYDLQGWGEVAAPNVFICFRLKNGYENGFYRQCFERNTHGIQLRKHITSGARSNGLLNISKEAFYSVAIPVPSHAEQQKIADCLSSLDDLIAAETQKLDTLKTHKKGLMQQLFPREGETVPRLRFPEFREEVEWSRTTVGHIADFSSGGTPSKERSAFWSGSIPWASAKDMKHFFLEDTEDHITQAAVDDGAKVVPAGTVLMLTRGMTLLKDVPICVLNRRMSFNQDVKALQPKSNFDGHFLAYLLLACKERLLGLVDIAGHGTGRLDTEKLKAFDVVLPQPTEQRRIADFLSSFDNLISAHSQKINILKSHKMGLESLTKPP